MPLALGVDLGGTKIEAILLDGEREIARQRVPTAQEEGYAAIVDRTSRLIDHVLALAGVSKDGVTFGVGMPGQVSRASGLVKNSNTVCLNGRPFREDLARAVGRPLAFENDANCFALAEAVRGAGAAYVDGVVFGVIMGTGVGGGLVVRGQVWPGIQGLGGEWGITPSGQGGATRAAATAVNADASRATQAGPRFSRTTPRAPANVERCRRSPRSVRPMRTRLLPSSRSSTPSVEGSPT